VRKPARLNLSRFLPDGRGEDANAGRRTQEIINIHTQKKASKTRITRTSELEYERQDEGKHCAQAPR